MFLWVFEELVAEGEIGHGKIEIKKIENANGRGVNMGWRGGAGLTRHWPVKKRGGLGWPAFHMRVQNANPTHILADRRVGGVAHLKKNY